MRRFGEYSQYATFTAYDAIPMIEVGLGHMALFPDEEFSQLRLEENTIALTSPSLNTAQKVAHALGADRVAASTQAKDGNGWIKYHTRDTSHNPARHLQIFGNTSHRNALAMSEDNSLAAEAATLYLRRLAMPVTSVTLDLAPDTIRYTLHTLLPHNALTSTSVMAIYDIGEHTESSNPYTIARRLPGGQILEIAATAPEYTKSSVRSSNWRWLRQGRGKHGQGPRFSG